MTPDELLALYAQYRDGCDAVNPSLEAMSKKDLIELVARVKKNPEEAIQLSRHHLAQIVRTLLTIHA